MDLASSHTEPLAIELAWGGKIPSTGDFVWSNGNSALRTHLDSWLINGMHQFRQTNGEDWQDKFDQAPLWNFIVPEGTFHQGCITGCISPSCDRVGRRFPFIVAYEFPTDLPEWFFVKMVNLAPNLLSRTGGLLFNAIRRNWHKEMLISTIEQAMESWQKALPTLELGLNGTPVDSVIMNILMTDTHEDNSLTIPNDRFSTYPWEDVACHLVAGSASSFWWTNGAGGARLKAFNYSAHPDATLMKWLFGQQSSTTLNL